MGIIAFHDLVQFEIERTGVTPTVTDASDGGTFANATYPASNLIDSDISTVWQRGNIDNSGTQTARIRMQWEHGGPRQPFQLYPGVIVLANVRAFDYASGDNILFNGCIVRCMIGSSAGGTQYLDRTYYIPPASVGTMRHAVFPLDFTSADIAAMGGDHLVGSTYQHIQFEITNAENSGGTVQAGRILLLAGLNADISIGQRPPELSAADASEIDYAYSGRRFTNPRYILPHYVGRLVNLSEPYIHGSVYRTIAGYSAVVPARYVSVQKINEAVGTRSEVLIIPRESIPSTQSSTQGNQELWGNQHVLGYLDAPIQTTFIESRDANGWRSTAEFAVTGLAPAAVPQP